MLSLFILSASALFMSIQYCCAFGQSSQQILTNGNTEKIEFTPRPPRKILDPNGWMSVTVTDKVYETNDIVSFVLAPASGRETLPHLAGQYINVRVFMDGEEVRRKYSLTSPSNGIDYRISVKREYNGRLSGYLHDSVAIGDLLDVYIPGGKFTLEDAARNNKPIVLITAGIGITPGIAMLREIHSDPIYASRPVRFIHCARSRHHYPFYHAVRHIQATATNRNIQLFTSYSNASRISESLSVSDGIDERNGRLTTQDLLDWLPPDRDAEVYFIGPRVFMAQVKSTLLKLGWPANQLHWEFFRKGPQLDEIICDEL